MPVKKTQFLINALANWGGFAAQVVITFFASPILIRGLGDQRYGLWALVESVLAYLTLFDLGIASSVVRYVAKYEAQEDPRNLGRVFSTSLCLFAAAGVVASGIVGILAFGWVRPLGAPQQYATEVRVLLLLLGVNLALGLPLGTFSAALDGLGRYPAKVAIRTCWLVLRTVVILARVRAGHGLVAIAVATTACNLAEHICMIIALRCYLPQLPFSYRLVDLETFRLIRGYSAYAFLAMIAGRISFQTDAMVIGAFLFPEAITFFVIAARLVDYAKSSFRSVTTVLTPAISGMEAQGNFDAIRDVWMISTRYVLWIAFPIEVGLFILGGPFLSLWLGAEYSHQSSPVLFVLAFPLVLVVAQFVSARILYGTGRLRLFTSVVIAEAIANLALSLLLVKSWGILGVALGTAAPNLLSNLVVIEFVRRILRVRASHYIKEAWLGPAFCSMIPALLWSISVRRTGVTNWLSFFLISGIGLLSYTVAFALSEFGTSGIRSVVKYFPSRFRSWREVSR